MELSKCFSLYVVNLFADVGMYTFQETEKKATKNLSG
jgi:hypothetical protein